MQVGNIIHMPNMTVVSDPVFIPNTDPRAHHFICRVMKTTSYGEPIMQEIHMWGKLAENCACILKFKSKVNLKGFFDCTTLYLSTGKEMKPAFQVDKIEFLNDNVLPSGLKRFDYERHYLNTGRFGNARVWTKEYGFLTEPTMYIEIQII